ncbi:MAG: hypothetical protein Q9227_005196 [Pyrenula ochraceoflavens]
MSDTDHTFSSDSGAYFASTPPSDTISEAMESVLDLQTWHSRWRPHLENDGMEVLDDNHKIDRMIASWVYAVAFSGTAWNETRALRPSRDRITTNAEIEALKAYSHHGAIGFHSFVAVVYVHICPGLRVSDKELDAVVSLQRPRLQSDSLYKNEIGDLISWYRAVVDRVEPILEDFRSLCQSRQNEGPNSSTEGIAEGHTG